VKLDTVSKTSRHHKRGGKTKNKIKVKDKSQPLNIDFLNIRGITSKMVDLNRHLKSEKVSIFGCAETFSTSDENPYILDNDYQWVGKCRKGNKTKGGIGLCVSRQLTILDDNLTDSKTDSFERLWTLIRMKDMKTAVGIAYFLNDGIDKENTEALFYELLENINNFNNFGYNIILMEDFNGRNMSPYWQNHIKESLII
jgi:hypothetical protein